MNITTNTKKKVLVWVLGLFQIIPLFVLFDWIIRSHRTFRNPFVTLPSGLMGGCDVASIECMSKNESLFVLGFSSFFAFVVIWTFFSAVKGYRWGLIGNALLILLFFLFFFAIGIHILG